MHILVESIKNAGGLLISRPSSVLDMNHMSIHGRKNQSVRSISLFFGHSRSISIWNAWILLFLVESSISVEYFGASASINRTKRLKNEQIECLDCIYMEKEKRKAHPISGHRYVLLLLTWRVKLIRPGDTTSKLLFQRHFSVETMSL